MDVFFYEVFKEEGKLIRKLAEGKFQFGLTEETIQESGHSYPPARLISIRTQSIIPVHWNEMLDGVLSRTTGFDHLQKYRWLSKGGPICGYLDEYATRAVAEHAILMILSLIRKLPLQMRNFRKFNRNNLTGEECADKNLLVTGVGRIGSEIIKIAKAIGMNVRGVDIVRRCDFVNYTTIDEGIRWADCIVCAMNLTQENFHYFSYDLLKKARRGVIFVNIARGEHSPLKDMLRLIKEGHIAGLGLDVFEDESKIATAIRRNENAENLKIIKELLSYPNVILTPHNAFNTREALERKVSFSINEIIFFLENKKFHNFV